MDFSLETVGPLLDVVARFTSVVECKLDRVRRRIMAFGEQHRFKSPPPTTTNKKRSSAAMAVVVPLAAKSPMKHGYSRHYDKPRQEISKTLKYTIFFTNFFFLLFGVTCLLMGGYVSVKEGRPLSDLVDVVLNPAVLALLVGGIIAVVCLCGCVGALREHICLLKAFTLLVFLSYICLVLITFMLFLLFYSDTNQGVSANTLLLKAVTDYHQNDNLKDFIDTVQEQLNCCGVTSHSQGFRDWERSAQFNCSTANPYPEFRCGVPHSCCKKLTTAAASTTDRQLFLPAIHSYQCWQHAQEKSHKELEDLIHMKGCLSPLQDIFQGHAVHIGAVVGIIIIPVCISVLMANIFAKQIDRQKFLLEREVRREDRRLRKIRHKLRQQPPPPTTTTTARQQEVNNNDVASSSATAVKVVDDIYDHVADVKEETGNSADTPDAAVLTATAPRPPKPLHRTRRLEPAISAAPDKHRRAHPKRKQSAPGTVAADKSLPAMRSKRSDPSPFVAATMDAGRLKKSRRTSNEGAPPRPMTTKTRDLSRRRSIAIPIYEEHYPGGRGAPPPLVTNKRNSVSHWLSQNNFSIVDPKDKDMVD